MAFYVEIYCPECGGDGFRRPAPLLDEVLPAMRWKRQVCEVSKYR